MYNLFADNEKLILDTIAKDKSDNNKFIFLIGGQFGAGKSEFINRISEKDNINSYSDIILKFSYNHQYYFFPDFLKNSQALFANDFNEKSIRFEEINYFYETFYLNFNSLNAINPDFNQKFIKFSQLKSIPEFNSFEKESSALLKEIEPFIIENIDKKGYQRILLQTFKVATESLIMDLLTFFFLSRDNKELKDIEIGGNKKIITFIFDNYDRVAGTINHWIFDILIDYLRNKKFSEFVSYTINFENSDLKVADLFDINFIIAGRFVNQQFLQTIKHDYLPSSELIELKFFDKNSLKSFLVLQFSELAEKSDEIFGYSKASPAVVFHITKHYSKFRKLPDRNDILNFIINQIFLYTPEKFKKFVIVASYIEKFEQTYFRCFDDTKSNLEDAFTFIFSATDFFSYSKKENYYQLYDNISESIRDYIITNFPQLHNNYKSIADVYNACFEIIQPFSYEEIKILRSLAYLKFIEFDFILKEIYQEDYNSVCDFVKKNKHLFHEKEGIYNLKAEIREKLDALNQLIDGENYYLKIDSINNLWQKTLSNAAEEIKEKKNKFQSCQTDIKILEDCISSDKINFESTQKNFIEKENELIDLRKQLNIYTNNRYYTNSGLNLIFAIFVALFSYFFPDIFSSPENHSSLIMVQVILYFIVIVFGVLSLYNLYQGLKLASKNKQKFEINTKMMKAEHERANLQEQMTRLKENQELNKKTLLEKKEQLDLLKKRIQALEKFLKIEF